MVEGESGVGSGHGATVQAGGGGAGALLVVGIRRVVGISFGCRLTCAVQECAIVRGQTGKWVS